MTRIQTCTLLLSLLLSLPSPAPLAAAGEGPCQAPTTSAEVAACEAYRLKADELALNAAYQRLLEQLDSPEPGDREGRAILVKAQRHWVAFREQDCRAKLVLRGDASLRHWYHQNCLREHARQRTKQLNAFRMD